MMTLLSEDENAGYHFSRDIVNMLWFVAIVNQNAAIYYLLFTIYNLSPIPKE